MTALYNEFDAFAAQWLRQLSMNDHIAPGYVDDRSIEDLTPDELRAFDQVHLFAGVGVWSYALRRIGWPDHKPIWTASCPCQPFSAAGKGGGFDDERHLWPHVFHLVTQCRPERIVGEQVASKDGLAWLDLVQADMEAAGYAFAAVDLCAAGVGAPHIRQRLYWYAQRLDDATGTRHVGAFEGTEGNPRNETRLRVPGTGSGPSGLDHHHHTGLEGQRGGHSTTIRHGQEPLRPASTAGEFGGMGNPSSVGRQSQSAQLREHENGMGPRGREQIVRFETGRDVSDRTPTTGPTNGQWRDADWLHCRDGKWRAVESGTFPLAHGAAARVGRLRGYGNAIVAPLAEEFLKAALLDEHVI